MEHSEALRTKAAERYVLGEMGPADREEYEAHFFSCMECAQEVQAAAEFIDNAHDALRAAPAALSPRANLVASRSWFGWFLRPSFALPAMALLLLIVGYQTAYVIPKMSSALRNAAAAQTLPSLSLLGANSRGGEVPELTIPPDKPFSMFLDIPPNQQFPSYLCEVQNESGSVQFAVNVSAQEAKQTVQIMVPGNKLRAGKYITVVEGNGPSQTSGKTEIGRYPFTLNISQ